MTPFKFLGPRTMATETSSGGGRHMSDLFQLSLSNPFWETTQSGRIMWIVNK